jgi:hypothetical protein
MFIPARPEFYEQVAEKYSDVFLEKIFKLMKLGGLEEREAFKKIAIQTSAGYLEFIENNHDRLRPHEVTELFNDLKVAFEEVNNIFVKITADRTADTKFHLALSDEFKKQTERVKQMLAPYQDETRTNVGVLEKFFLALIESSEKAKNKDIGVEKSKVSSGALPWWVATIGLAWSKSSPVEFYAGDYKSPAHEALFLLMQKIDPVTKANVKTAMRKAIVKGQIQNPAKLLLN